MRIRESLIVGALLLALPAAGQDGPKQTINPPTLPNSVQYGYSQATIVPPGGATIFVAGQVGVTEAGPNDFRSQVDRSFDNLLAALAAAGSDAQHVAKITVLIVDHDPEKLAYLGAKRRAVFGATPPASTLIPVTKLYADGVTFEIDATAVVRRR